MIPPLDPVVEAETTTKKTEEIPAPQKEVELVDERTATSQVYQQENGMQRLEISPEPIHVLDEKTKKWEPIDNTLVEKETGRIHNQKNEFDASFPTESAPTESIVSIEQEGKKVEIETVQQNNEQAAEVPATVDENKVTYKEIYPNTDLSYTVSSTKVKEDIILKEKPSGEQPLEYSFDYNITGLNLEKGEDGSYYLLDSSTKDRLFAIEKPFMVDSFKPEGFVSVMDQPTPEGSWSDQIEMDVHQDGNKLSLTIKPSMEWLMNAERVYPVVIDPTVKVYQPKNELNDTTIRSALPDTTGGADLELGTGLYQSGSTNNIVRSLLQFNVGTLPAGSKIMNAQLNLRLSSVWNDTASAIQLFEMGNAWEENRATWNRRTIDALWTNKGGDYKPTSLSLQTIGALDTTLPEPKLYKWPISTDVVQKWFAQPTQNIGLMLKAQNETLATYKKFYSGDASGTTGDLKYSPTLSITYAPVSRLGLEDYWSYAEHDLSDGQGYTNLGTGNTVLQFTDFEVSGRGNSGYAFSRTYNSKATDDTAAGFRWSFTGGETVTEFDNKNVLYTEADGTAHTFTYNATDGSYTAPAGLYLTLRRAASNAYEIKDYNGNRTVFRDLINNAEVNGRMFLIEYEEDRNLNRTTYQRLTDGTLSSITDASGRKLELGYENGRITSTTFEDTKKTSYTYDTNGNLKTSTIYKDGTTGSTTTFTYNTAGELITILDANGQATNYTYTDGFLTNVQQPSISDTALSKTTYSYDIVNHLAAEKDANGNETTYILDDNYAIVETIDPTGFSSTVEYDANYNPVVTTDAMGSSTYNTYDSKGNLLTTKDPLGNTITYTYNEFSQPVKVIDSKGETTNIYNSLGDLIEEINPAQERTLHEYDSYGNLIRTTFADGTKENYTYDANKNYQISGTDPLGRTTTTIQDKFGNTTSVTDPAQKTTYYTYDLQNRLTQVKDPKGNVTAYTYDANGNLKTTTNAALKQTEFTYNAQNQLIKRQEPLKQATSFVYDANGNIKETNFPSGDKLQNLYNQNNQLAHVAVNGSRKWSYFYDANGNISSILNVMNDVTKTFTYDKNDKLTKYVLGNQSIEYIYDGTGIATYTIGKSGTQSFTQNYTIDSLERMTHLKRNGTSQASLTYTKTDLPATISYINNIKSTYEYDVAGQLKTLSVTKGTAPFDAFAYEYDVRGNITKATSNAGTALYEYDDNNQLVKETTVDGAVITYEYDSVGNRTKKTVVKNGQTTVTSYTYNANNQLTVSDNQAYSYDSNGNRTSDGRYKYIYNKLNELVEIQTLAGQTVATYTYNEDSYRTSKTVSGQTTFYHYDGDQVLFETNEAGTIIAEYSYDDYGRPLTMTRNGQTYFYVLNEHRDVIALTDSAGNIVASYTYDAWGKILSKNGIMADVNPFRYASYRYDNETGAYYLLARYYNSEDGLFLSIDPQPGELIDPLSQHRYNYVLNNPVMLDDPDGENPLVILIVYTGGRYVVKKIAKKQLKKVLKQTQGMKVVNGFTTKVHSGKQGKHIAGHNNYQKGKSILTGNAQNLLNKYAGRGTMINSNKERVNFGQVIGKWVDPNTGKAYKTTKGIIHYSKNGAHIVPSRPW